MSEVAGFISLIGLIILILFNLINDFLREDKSRIFNPITFFSLFYAYYIIYTYFFGNIDLYHDGSDRYAYLVLMAAFVHLLMICFGFQISFGKRTFEGMTTFVNKDNSLSIGVFLFVFGFICYTLAVGFRPTIFVEPEMDEVSTNKSMMTNYLIQTIDLFAPACALIWASKRHRLISLIFLIVSCAIYIVCGYRFRFVLLGITVFVVYQLFPKPKKINFVIVIPILIAAYFLFSLMDVSRIYGRGLDREIVLRTDISELKGGPSEGSSVFSCSEYVMNKYSNGAPYVYFQPLWCAITMPIPRSIYPNKPNAEYVHNAGSPIHRASGAAIFVFVEAFMAFGWIGVILNGLLVGLLSRIFWDNYLKHKNNLGAILLLGLYDGWCYVLVSRGYLAQVFMIFIFYVCLPFWLGKLYLYITSSLSRRKQTNRYVL